jgi:hypothetical protein
MKIPLFSRKSDSLQPKSTADETGSTALRALLKYLNHAEAEQPLIRQTTAGGVLFDMVRSMVTVDGRARVEDLLAILASAGGFSCVAVALSDISETTGKEDDLIAIEGADGYRYYFGNLPNFYLAEDKYSLLGLVLGEAQVCGGAVSWDEVMQTMRHVAGTVGGIEFGKPRLPAEHLPGDLPYNFVYHLWPKILELLNAYEVPLKQWPVTIGFALQRTIEAAKDVIDPALAARIAIECAVPMSKIDPERIART